MKKFAALTVLLTLVSCNGYENLQTPFNFSGKGVNLSGSDTKSTGESNTFEVVVNAPAGTSESIAMGLFDQEAKRVCNGRAFTKQIVSSGTANVRSFGMKGVDTSAVDAQAPSLKGYVTCQQ